MRLAYLNVSQLPENVSTEHFTVYRTEKLERIRRDNIRRLEIGAEYLLKQMLCDYGLGLDETTQITVTSTGKPYLTNEKLYFNLSHSGSICACGISEKEIGVDIQEKVLPPDALLKRYFSEYEQNRIRTAADPAQEFTLLWTLKEAYIKYKGTTISDALEKTRIVSEDFSPFDSSFVSVGSFLIDRYVLSCCSMAGEEIAVPCDLTETILRTL